jgi:hypothetical protein
MKDPESRRIMLGIANDYDQLAKRAQERASRRHRRFTQFIGGLRLPHGMGNGAP